MLALYAAILFDIGAVAQEAKLAQRVLRVSIFLIPLTIIFDIFYLFYGTIVSCE